MLSIVSFGVFVAASSEGPETGFSRSSMVPLELFLARRQSRKSCGNSTLTIRAGVHTCEIELRGNDVAGVGVHVAARIQAAAAPDQILVSRTVRELVAGSGIQFASAGTHQLKGVSGEWPLYRVSSGVAAQHGDGAETKERRRRAADHAERARLAVTKAVKSALHRLAAVHPRLAAYLQPTVRRGFFCVYTPDPPITWLRE
jgi:hypothetical protein